MVSWGGAGCDYGVVVEGGGVTAAPSPLCSCCILTPCFVSLSPLSFNATVTDMEGFNSHLNMEQMNKALISLTDMYVKAAADGRPAPNGA